VRPRAPEQEAAAVETPGKLSGGGGGREALLPSVVVAATWGYSETGGRRGRNVVELTLRRACARQVRRQIQKERTSRGPCKKPDRGHTILSTAAAVKGGLEKQGKK